MIRYVVDVILIVVVAVVGITKHVVSPPTSHTHIPKILPLLSLSHTHTLLDDTTPTPISNVGWMGTRHHDE